MSIDVIAHQLTVALRCVDANSGRTLLTPRPSAPGLHFTRNHAGDFLLLDRPELASVSVQVDDPTGDYLPRRVQIKLPRQGDPALAQAPDSLYQAQHIAMFPAPAASIPSGWAVVRATVVDAANGAALPGALLRLTQTDGDRLIARGLTDWRGRAAGEALLAAPGVPAITFGPANGNGAVLVSQIDASIEAIFDPLSPASGTSPPDPDDLEARRAQLPRATEAILISAGKSVSVRIAVALD